MEDFPFPDPPEPKDLPWWRRIPHTYYWWAASIVLLAIAFVWLPSQCSMEAFNLPQGEKNDFEDLEKVDQDKQLEFRVDELWYKIDADQPFDGLALSYHENGTLRSQTKIKEGKAYGLIEEWDENGTRRGTQFKNEFTPTE